MLFLFVFSGVLKLLFVPFAECMCLSLLLLLNWFYNSKCCHCVFWLCFCWVCTLVILLTDVFVVDVVVVVVVVGR